MKSYIFLNRDKLEKKRTYCVMGSARGGTTMVSGLLSRLGIHMGNDIAPATDEDREFRSTVRPLEDLLNSESSNHKLIMNNVFDLIKRKNKEMDVWGWKDPESMIYHHMIKDKLVNPCYILVFRDPMAIVQKELNTGLHNDPVETLETIIMHRYKHMLDFVKNTERPVLLISYERALKNKEELIESLSEFCDITLSDRLLSQCKEFIQPNKHPKTNE